MIAPKESVLRRSLRRFTLGSGPLKRGSDRVQLVGRLLVVLSFLLAPPLAVGTTTRATAHLQTVAAGQAAERSPVRAVLLEDAPGTGTRSTYYADAGSSNTATRAVWPVPGGTSREGTVLVAPGSSAGTSVKVWVTRYGSLTRPPLDPAGIEATATAVGALPLIGLPLAAWALYAVLSVALDGHRDRRWAQKWAEVEPRWNSARP
jgi:hypothetical protein